MSLYGSLIAGVSGLKAQTQSMATISDNIANVNTFGYKKSNSYFSTLVTGAGATTSYSPGGLRATPRALIDQQGVLQSTQRPTDVAVLGNGFFVVNSADGTAGEQLYTRAGSFTEDKQGRLVNGAGYFLQGWQLDQGGNIIDINAIETVSVGTLNGVAVDTTTVQIGANINASTTPSAAPWNALTTGTFAIANADAMSATGFTADFRRDIRVYDSLGTAHNMTLSVMKVTTTNGWVYSLSSPDATAIGGTSNNVFAWGAMTFNGDGSLASATLSTTAAAPAALTPSGDGSIVGPLTIDWLNGAANSAIDFDFGTQNLTDGFTQFAADNNISFINQDGAAVGLRTGVAVDSEGYVVASFSNGATKKIWKLPIATFANPNALLARNGNAFAQTAGSGEFNLREANTGGAGRVEPAALEGSNVDLGEEFTQMITTQRAYSASARVITTADEMLDELLRVKR
jgi:flagellar hook protein FlgE